MKPFELKVSKEVVNKSESFVNKLVSSSDSEQLKELSDLGYPELDVLKWTQHPQFVRGLKTNNAKSIAELIFDQNDFIKSNYDDPEPEPRATVLVVGVALGAAVTVGLAMHVYVITATEMVMSVNTKVWGRSALSKWLDKTMLNPVQRNIALAVQLICSEEMKSEVSKEYGTMMVEFAKDQMSKREIAEA